MNDSKQIPFNQLLSETKDGDWGREIGGVGLVPYRVIRATDFAAASLGDASRIPLRHLPTNTVHRRTLQLGDILIETAGGSPGRPTGRTMLVTDRVLSSLDGPATCASFSRFLRPDNGKVDSRYLFWFLQDLYKSGRIEKYQVQHTGVARFQYTNFAASQLVPVPEFPLQRAIAEVLGALDDKIAANTKLADTTDQYLASRFKLEIRGGCDVSMLATVAEVNAESAKPVKGESLRYIDIASVGVGTHTHPDLTMWDDAPNRARRRVRKGDILWSTVRPNRRSHSLNLSDDARLVASTGIAVLSPRSVGFAYLYEATRLPEFVEYLESVAEGSAYPAVRAGLFAEAPVPLLSAERRASFEAIAAPMRDHLHSLSEENRTLAELRDTLLPELMSGRLRVKDAEQQVGEIV